MMDAISLYAFYVQESDREALCDDIIKQWEVLSDSENVSAAGKLGMSIKYTYQ